MRVLSTPRWPTGGGEWVMLPAHLARAVVASWVSGAGSCHGSAAATAAAEPAPMDTPAPYNASASDETPSLAALTASPAAPASAVATRGLPAARGLLAPKLSCGCSGAWGVVGLVAHVPPLDMLPIWATTCGRGKQRALRLVAFLAQRSACVHASPLGFPLHQAPHATQKSDGFNPNGWGSGNLIGDPAALVCLSRSVGRAQAPLLDASHRQSLSARTECMTAKRFMSSRAHAPMLLCAHSWGGG
jgi:hypothetical protein